ncbi:spore coat protein [Salimicrobium halophilum]|uniref:Spore coat protein CotF n=1 Tax=Salimicrobium halophilum TaxID=86666 RepID=A0A1G8U877_9BACI|nr:spore coat protein [Salimicrobium halophilum]SDJ49988.1 Spore coat protein CotF [Salimicrobium halophilum]
MHNQYHSQSEENNRQPAGQYGGHEVFDAHEVLSGVIGILDHYKLYEQHVQDPELKTMINRQSSFLLTTYNTMVETFHTGKRPSTPTLVYNMTQENNVSLGMTPGQPKTPAQSVQELNDENISGFMLGQTKGIASSLTMAALEVTNPVLRRVFADSVPNIIEMGYEIFLYQNKHNYYQVAQLTHEDMNAMVHSYDSTGGNQPH